MTKESNQAPNFKSQTRKAWWWFATWFGSGLAPKASGTAGSLAALPFAFLIQYYAGNLALFIAAIVLFFIGWWASNKYMEYHAEKHDPKEIVVDEVAGMWLTLSLLFPQELGSLLIYKFFPAYNSYFFLIFMGCVSGFILFRIFDAIKPWPISVADRKIKGGFGVMFDDILAAIYPLIIIIIIYIIADTFFPRHLGVFMGELYCDENYENCEV